MGGNACAEATVEATVSVRLGSSLGLEWAGAQLKSEGFVQPVVLLVLITLAVSHWFLEPLVLLFKPFFLLSWLPWVFFGVGLWLLAGDDSQSSGR